MFQNLKTSKTFMLSRGHRAFPLFFFGLPVLKKFASNTFNLPENFGYRIFFMHENGKSRPSVEIFCLRVRKKIVGATSKFQNVWDLENFCCISQFSFHFFVSHYRKLREEPSNASKSFNCEVSKKFMNKNGISRFSVGNFLAQSAKYFVVEHFGI